LHLFSINVRNQLLLEAALYYYNRALSIKTEKQFLQSAIVPEERGALDETAATRIVAALPMSPFVHLALSLLRTVQQSAARWAARRSVEQTASGAPPLSTAAEIHSRVAGHLLLHVVFVIAEKWRLCIFVVFFPELIIFEGFVGYYHRVVSIVDFLKAIKNCIFIL
jgi:hypothetical protein